MKDTKELSPVQVLREATTADLASEIGTARSVSGSAIRHAQPCPPLGMILDFCQLVPLVIKCHFA